MTSPSEPGAAAPPTSAHALAAENAELQLRLQELEELLYSIQHGEVDALIVNDDIYTLESAHAATNRMRQDVLGQMEDAVFAFDADDRIIFLNAAAERRYGVLSADVLGAHRSAVFDDSTTAEAAEAGAQPTNLPHGAPQAGGPATHRLRSGASIDVETIASPLNDADGRPIGVLAVVRDVTERRRTEAWQAALMALNDQFRQLDNAAEIAVSAARIVGITLAADHVVYGALDVATACLQPQGEWAAPGTDLPAETPADTAADKPPPCDYTRLLVALQRGLAIRIADVHADPRTTPEAARWQAAGVTALVVVPLLEQDRLVAVMVVQHSTRRDWSAHELRFIQDVAERTRAVSERARGALALRASEQRLRDANETLEARVEARTQELRDAEQALRQAQKMEAVGQLTGGIAHDFNNLLAAMSGSLQVLKVRLSKGNVDGWERYIGIGQDSVRRAASLTQRLLAFARRQTLDPKPTDVNLLVAGMAELIQRSVGPNVTVEVLGDSQLWLTRIDPSQLENSLLNLCINARDAMQPGGGLLRIATANEWLDDGAAVAHDLPAGAYVALRVSDTGSGMSPEVLKRVFDPFFTTKPLGQGTGLGLSMVYGFVRQSGGQVRIDSVPGQGSTMCLYLPRHVGLQQPEALRGVLGDIAAGDGETILVVEDEESIRLLILEVLDSAGYQAIGRADGATAMEVLQSGRRIDLLITDVGLPGGMNGRQVADQARVARPALKVLFVTGYAEHSAVGDGQLEQGMAVLTKPFEIAVLAQRVKQMLAG